MAAAAASGAFAGLILDAAVDEVNTAFVRDVSKALAKGKISIVAEIDETWTVPVDSRLEPTQAVWFRRLRNEVVEDLLSRESTALAAEYKELAEEMAGADEERKEQLQSAARKLIQKAVAIDDLIKRKLFEIINEREAKINAIKEQITTINERRRRKMEQRLDELRKEYGGRIEKLKRSANLIREAVGPREKPEKKEIESV